MRLLILILLGLTAPAYGQPLPPAEQALQARYLSELGRGLQCEAQAITLTARVTQLEKELAELKAKPEKK